MRVLITSDNPVLTRQARGVLARHGLDSHSGSAVSLKMATDRVVQVLPELVLLVLTPDSVAGLQVLREIRNTVPGVQVLVVGPTSNPKLILETLKLGAAEYLDQEILEAELEGSLAHRKARQKPAAAPASAGRIIAILGSSGGCGASTLAANISIVLAQQHGECGLLDLRLGAGDLALLLDVQPVHNLADLCEHLDHADQTLFDQVLVRHTSGVHLLAAPPHLSDAQRVTSQGVRRAVALARSRFRCVVVDVGTLVVADQVDALWLADQILLIVRLDYSSLRNARRVIETLAESGIERERLRLVVNGCRQRQQLEVHQAETALAMKITHQVPYAPGAVNAALNQGVPVVLQHRYAGVTRSLRQLASSVSGLPQKHAKDANRVSPIMELWTSLTRQVAPESNA